MGKENNVHNLGQIYVKRGISSKTGNPYEMLVTFVAIEDIEYMQIVNINDRIAKAKLIQCCEEA